MADKNWWQITEQQRADEANKRLNIALRSQEKVEAKSSVDLEGKFAWDEATLASSTESSLPVNFDITVPNDVVTGGEEMLDAPTKNPSRPRAYAIGYNPQSKTVYIVFRSGAWWQYNDVGTDVWLGLKNSDSTNEYLPTLEMACSSHGPARLNDMSSASQEKLSYTAAIASNIQNTPLYQTVRNMMAEEGLPDISQ